MNTCDFDGTLVSADRWLPTAAFDHRFSPAAGPVPGCNHLRCAACGEEVRSIAGIAAGPGFVPRFAFGQGVTTDLEGTEARARARLYFCRCLSHTELSTTDLVVPPELAGRGFEPPWRCAGHPPLTPGTIVDGDRIDDSSILDVVERRLARPDAALPDGLTMADVGAPAFWLARLRGLLERSAAGAALADEVERLVLGHLLHPDAVVRFVVLNFVDLVQPDGGDRAVVDAARREPTAFTGEVTIAGSTFALGRTASKIAGRSAGAGTTGGEGARELLKQQVLDGSAGRTGLLDVAEQDHGWLLDHAVEIYRAQPDLLSTLVRQVADGTAARTTSIIRAVVGAGADPEEVRRIVDRYLVGPDAEAILAGLP